jgi:hypothetical protein
MKHRVIVTAIIGAFCHAATAALVTFEEINLPPAGFQNDFGGQFVVGNATFYSNNDFEAGTWSGFGVSNLSDNSSTGPNKESTAIPGGGLGGSANYAIGLYSTDAFESTVVTFSSITSLLGRGTYITNTTWAYYEMADGGSLNPKKFGGPTGDEADWFKLVIEGFVGLNPAGEAVEFYLADFRPADNAQDYIVDDWRFVDLSPLGSVDRLTFKLVTSDTGVTVPAYFAMDHFMAVPEPSSLLIVVGGLGLMLRRKR